MGDWSDGELNYVKVRWVQQDNGVHNWIGWLGVSDTEPMVPKFVGDPSEAPDGVIAVRWVLDRRGELAEQYLCAIDVPGGGVRYLGSYHASVELPAWVPTSDKAFPIKVARVAGTNEVVLVRPSDQAGLYTTNTPGVLQWGWQGSGSPVTFELVPQHGRAGGNENWMRAQNATIGDLPLSQIMIPGAHDAGASAILVAPPGAGDDCTSKTQKTPIGGQLAAGVRYLDLRAWWWAHDGHWYMYHGESWTMIRYDWLLQSLNTFLLLHPDEVVIASLLVEDVKGLDAFEGRGKEAWEMAFAEVGAFHQDSLDADGQPVDFNDLTPNEMRRRGKNLILFTWGVTTSWHFTKPDGHDGYACPWAAEADEAPAPNSQMNLAGVYVNDAMATARDILNAYDAFPAPADKGWILHTNTPWSLGHSGDCLYDKHVRNTPDLMTWTDQGAIGRPKANIVNIDYVDDVVIADGICYDLTNSVIKANLL